jgi:Putative auto-transporter adhesin, head GIN domain
MKNSTNLILAPLVAMATAGNAQTQSEFAYAVKEIKVEAFKQLSVNAKLDVVLVQNNEYRTVFIEGDEKLVKEIAVSVKDGRLVIDSKNDISYHGKLQVTVVVNQLDRIRLNGEGALAWVNGK